MINVEAGRLREPAAWLMVAVASASVLVGIERLLFGASSPFGGSFAARAAAFVGQLTSPVTAALLVGAVLLATHLGPVIERLRLMALVATGTLGLSVLFGVTSLFGALFGGATDFREKIELLLLHLPALALTTLALLYVLPKAVPAGSGAGSLRAEGGFGRSPEHPQEQGYAYPAPSAPVPGQVPFHEQGRGAPQGVYPQGQMPQQGVHHPQDQAPQGGHGYPQEAPPAQVPQGGHGYPQEAPPAQAPQPSHNLPALPPAPAHGSAGVPEGYGQQAASYPPSAPQADGHPQAPYPQPLPQAADVHPQASYAAPAESQPYAAPPGAYSPAPQQPEPQAQGYAQPEQANHQWSAPQAPQASQPAPPPNVQTGGYTPNPYVAADVQPPVPAKQYDPPIYAAPMEQQPQTEPRLPSYPQFPDSAAYGQPEPQGFGQQPDSSAYGQEAQPVSSGRHSSPRLPSYPQFPDSPAYGQPEPQGLGQQPDSSAYGQEAQPTGSGWHPEPQAPGYQQQESHGYPQSEPPSYQRPEPQGFGQQDPQQPGYGHQPEQQAAATYPPADGRQGQTFDGQPPQSFPQPPENYGQPFGGYQSSEFGRPAESPHYPAPDPVDLRSQQMAQAYQQAESYQQQAQGTEPQLRVPEYGSSGYEGPFGHPPQSPAPQAPYQPGGGHQWDPRSEATLKFDPSAYTGDPLSDPGPAARTWDSQPIDPTAIYKPEQRPGQVTDEESPDRERVGPGQDQNMSWYGSDRREP